MCFFLSSLDLSTLYIFMNLVLHTALSLRWAVLPHAICMHQNKHVPVKIHLLHTIKTQSYTRFTYIRIYNIIGLVKRTQFNNYNKSSLSELLQFTTKRKYNSRAKGIEKIINYLNDKNNNKNDSCVF